MREGYKKTEVGVIPENWEVKQLDDISNITRLAGAEYSDLWQTSLDGEIIALRGFNIGANKIYLNDVERISSELSNRLIRSKLFKGDIVFPCVGTIGKAAVINTDNKYHINQNIAKITPYKSIYSLYLSYFLISKIVQKQIYKYNTSSSQPNVLVGNLRKFNITVPPLKEQEKIAEILSTIDLQIDDTEKLIEKSMELKKGLMQKLLTKGIGHSEFKKTEVGEIPVEWEVKKLGELGNYYNGLTGKTKSDFENGNCKFITYSNVNLNTFVDLESLGSVNIFDNEKQNCVKYGDIIFTGSSENPEEAGMTSVFINHIDNIYLNSFCFGYRLNNILDINPKFLAYYLRGEEFRKNIFPLAQGSTRYNISKTEVMNLEVVIPSTNEQEKIVDILLSIDNQIKEYKNKKQKLEELKKGLMQQLLTGKIRV